ncbi:hypothetical protein J1N35_019234 [Gossypium stocksii]|uniref:Uncharacterized protein n=1 Tax=Gossypium stocksii TaxID=47602 RepID=A0A9D3VRS9_9ROSI|nr:hypothetical protein J1N35_019234 [Gossypium stocksii]
MIGPKGPDGTYHVLAPMYKCNTNEEELNRHLGTRAILRLNFAYNFHVARGECHQSDNIEGFILPFFLLEVGFQFPINAFFCLVLNEYGTAPRQLSAFSW